MILIMMIALYFFLSELNSTLQQKYNIRIMVKNWNKCWIEWGFCIIWRIMEISEGVTEADNTLRDIHNSSDDTKAEFNNCFIIHSNW